MLALAQTTEGDCDTRAANDDYINGGPGTRTKYMYDEGGRYSGQYFGSGALGNETFWLGDIPVAFILQGHKPSVYYLHTDHLNTPRQVTRATDNAQMWTWFSEPFGATVANTNPQGQGTFSYALRFPGQIGGTGISWIVQNYFRDYDPAVGRYIESDPIGLNGGINTYAYAGGSPIALNDMLGLACRRGERVLRNDFFKDLSKSQELGVLQIPFFGQLNVEPGISPELTPTGIRPSFRPSFSWQWGYFTWEQDRITTGYVYSKFFSRKYYCTSDDPCHSKSWVEIRNDGEFEQKSFYDTYNQWTYIGFISTGYGSALP
jgi:RHS repeat-associated protein